MKLMGLTSAALWSSWFITLYAFVAISMVIVSVLLTVPLSGLMERDEPVVTFGDASLVLLLMLCYGAAIVSYCFMMSVVVQKGWVCVCVCVCVRASECVCMCVCKTDIFFNSQTTVM